MRVLSFKGLIVVLVLFQELVHITDFPINIKSLILIVGIVSLPVNGYGGSEHVLILLEATAGHALVTDLAD